MKNPIRIGFLSTAGIGRKNWKAIFHSGNCVVSAVASRDLQKSRDFIAACQREFTFTESPVALDSYEALITSPVVDAVYIPLPTALRREWVVRAAKNGKHILCEKPCAATSEDLNAMLTACRENNVQFLDGVMFMHNPRLDKIREVLEDGRSIGTLRRIASGFSFYVGEDFFRHNIRVNGALEPAGCLGDLGWYSIRFALWTLRWQLPESVSATIHALSVDLPDRPPAPTEFSAQLNYPGGVSVEFYCSFLAGRQQWMHVSGQQGWLRMPDFVHPLNGYEPTFEVNSKEVRVDSDVKCPSGGDPGGFGHPTAQDTRMWRNFANQILSGQLNEEWPRWAAKTQTVLDACCHAAIEGRTVRLTP